MAIRRRFNRYNSRKERLIVLFVAACGLVSDACTLLTLGCYDPDLRAWALFDLDWTQDY